MEKYHQILKALYQSPLAKQQEEAIFKQNIDLWSLKQIILQQNKNIDPQDIDNFYQYVQSLYNAVNIDFEILRQLIKAGEQLINFRQEEEQAYPQRLPEEIMFIIYNEMIQRKHAIDIHFRIFDRDCDKILNDAELQKFICFYVPTLQNVEFDNIKLKYRMGNPTYVNQEMLKDSIMKGYDQYNSKKYYKILNPKIKIIEVQEINKIEGIRNNSQPKGQGLQSNNIVDRRQKQINKSNDYKSKQSQEKKGEEIQKIDIRDIDFNKRQKFNQEQLKQINNNRNLQILREQYKKKETEDCQLKKDNEKQINANKQNQDIQQKQIQKQRQIEQAIKRERQIQIQKKKEEDKLKQQQDLEKEIEDQRFIEQQFEIEKEIQNQIKKDQEKQRGLLEQQKQMEKQKQIELQLQLLREKESEIQKKKDEEKQKQLLELQKQAEKQKQIELQLQKEKEIQIQKKKDEEEQRQLLELQKQAEKQKQIELQLQKEKEIEIEIQRKKDEQKQRQLFEQQKQAEKQKQLEQQLLTEKEIEIQKKKDEEKQRQLLEQQKQAEKQKQIELQLQKEKEIEIQKKKDEEKQRQLLEQAEKQKQIELQLQKEKEIEIQKKKDEEKQRQLLEQAEKQKQLELQLQKEKEIEIQKKKDEEKQRQLLELQKQVEKEKEIEIQKKKDEEKQRQLLEQKKQAEKQKQIDLQLQQQRELIIQQSNNHLMESNIYENFDNLQILTSNIIFDNIIMPDFSIQNMTKFMEIYNKLEQNRQQFQDSDFPPQQKSIGQKLDYYEWERLSNLWQDTDIFKKYNTDSRIGLGKWISQSHILQGELGDCYFLTTISSIACRWPDWIRSLFITQKQNKEHIYCVKLCIDGIWQGIILDDYIPIKYNQPAFTKSNDHSIWVMLLEKAYAKAFGSYYNIKSGISTEVMRALTGCHTDDLITKQDDFDQKLFECIQQKCILTSGSISDQNGLVSSHSYSILKIRKVNHPKLGQITLLKLRNPWGEKEWNGDWSEDSQLWTQDLRNQLKLRKINEGVFYMSLKDFKIHFDQVSVGYFDQSYHYESQQFMINRRKALYFNFEVTQPGNYNILIYQPSKRFHKDKLNYEFSNLRLILAKEQNSTKILQYQQCGADNNICIGGILEKGKYVLQIKADWKFWEEYNINLCQYGQNILKFSKIQKDDFLKEMFLQYARCQKSLYKSMDNNLQSLEYIGLKFGVGFFYYINNSSDKQIQLSSSFEKQIGLKLKKPYRGNYFEMTLKPQQDEIVLFKIDPKEFNKSQQYSWKTR